MRLFGQRSEDVTKRYWVFEGSVYYPSGGMSDFFGSFDSVPAAITALRNDLDEWELQDKYHWAHILDSQTGQVVATDRDILDKESL